MSLRIFITGGASGLGLALAHRFADNGDKVCIGDIHTERGVEAEQALAAKTTAKFLTCNVQRESDLQSAADWLLAEWGGVDVVINNAGVASAGAIDEFSMEDWQWVMDINLLGVVRGCKVFSALMKSQGSGHIVNIASLAGLIHPPRMGSYCATKAAVVALSESMSLERDGGSSAVSVVGRLSAALRANPHLRVHVASGYHDGATPYLATEHTLATLPIPEELRANVEVRYYEAGHMMYVHTPSRLAQSADLAAFVTR